MTIEDEMVKLI